MSDSLKQNPLSEDEAATAARAFNDILDAVGQSIVGHRTLSERLAMAFVCEGHVLLEGLPGLAKTTVAKTFAAAAELSMNRIQFTPDLLPADVVGTQVYDPKEGNFYTKQGPIFANLVIADEINRAPAKVQSALLQAMQEREVTLGETTYKLPAPFVVLATQNPIEQEGTYPLPEAQLDRFLFKVKVGYNTKAEEIEMARRYAALSAPPTKRVWQSSDIARLKNMAARVHVADPLRSYIVDLVFATRAPEESGLAHLKSLIRYGASPRATLNLERAARAHALLKGRNFATPQDVKDVAPDVLRHRIILSYEADAQNISGDQVLGQVLEHVSVP